MDYLHKGKPLRWAALFEPGAIELFRTRKEFKAAARERGVGPQVERAIEIIRERRGAPIKKHPDEVSDQATKELVRTLKADAKQAGEEYASFEHFVGATKRGLLNSAWVYELPNLGGSNEPVNGGCRTFGPNLFRRVSSVYVSGGLILFQEPGCTTLPGQIPLTITTSTPLAVLDLGVWNRLAASAISWG